MPSSIKTSFPFFSFIAILTGVLLGRQYFKTVLIDQGITDYTSHTLLGMGINIVLIIISLIYIKRYKLSDLAGIGKSVLQHKVLLLFPLYLIAVNLLFADAIPTNHIVWNASLLLVYCLSVGLSEELSLRGFMQSYLIQHYGTSRKKVLWAVLGAAFIFGLLHLIKFDKGLYGELSQVLFATFIAVMFGVLLLRTKRLFPLVILHAIIDFAAGLDRMGQDVSLKTLNDTTLINAIVTTLIVLPCLIYGLVQYRKIKTYHTESYI